MAGGLRITGGSKRGKRLISPPRNSIRPASDLIRQAVFNMLADAIPGAVIYDVFAGTGIVGLDALSRGAARAIFVENDRSMVQLLRKNLQVAGFGMQAASVRQADSFVWGKHFFAEGDSNIVFLGPPYPEFRDHPERMAALVRDVQSQLGPSDYLILQFPKEVKVEDLPGPDHWFRIRQYGKTRIGIWQKDRVVHPANKDSDAALEHEVAHED